MFQKKKKNRIAKILAVLIFLSAFQYLCAQSDDSLIWAYSRLKLYNDALGITKAQLKKTDDQITGVRRERILHEELSCLIGLGDGLAALQLIDDEKNVLFNSDNIVMSFVFSDVYIRPVETARLSNLFRSLFSLQQYFQNQNDSLNFLIADFIKMKYQTDRLNTDSCLADFKFKSDFVNRSLSYDLKFYYNDLMAEFFIRKRKYIQVFFHLRQAVAYADTLKNPVLYQYSMDKLKIQYQSTGDFKNAFLIESNLIHFQDSIRKKEQQDAMKAVKWLFIKNVEGEKSIFEREQKIHELKLSIKENQNFILYLIILCLLLVVFLLIFFFRMKMRKRAIIKTMDSNEVSFKIREEKLAAANLGLLNEKNDLEVHFAALVNSMKDINTDAVFNKEKTEKLNATFDNIAALITTSANELQSVLGDYYAFCPTGKETNVFYPMLTVTRKLRPGRMFMEKGSASLSMIGEKFNYSLCTLVQTNSEYDFSLLPYIIKLRHNLTDRKIKNSADLICFFDENFRKEGTTENNGISVSFYNFDNESCEFVFLGLQCNAFIFRNGKIIASDFCEETIVHRDNLIPPPKVSRLTLNLKSKDLVYIVYRDSLVPGSIDEEAEYYYIKEFLRVLTPLNFEEQKEILRTEYINAQQNLHSNLATNKKSNLFLQAFCVT